MAAIRTMTNLIIREFIHHPLLFHSSSKSFHSLFPTLRRTPGIARVHSSSRFGSFRCAASNSGGGDRKVSSRLSQVQQMLHEAEERASSAGNEPTPQITLGKVQFVLISKRYNVIRTLLCSGFDGKFTDNVIRTLFSSHFDGNIYRKCYDNSDHVTLNFARSGGPGGQNVNKGEESDQQGWRACDIFDQNQNAEYVLRRGNIDDALAKLQAIIDAASYVPPPPSEEQKKKIVKMAAKADEKRLKSKKVLSDKKAARRDRSSWD
ncbi:hypothetical protein DY000_02012578 [Brassica cretica]|uniref:Prokaryotic-type class I peptide chain release factors domain-containing protein n=1 Tax=Brassica cretica TaxID=69181 RepID=A0ABQ7DA07_BRACR|nr:hypothetical protein DY000_02012578 [Brassica cretica]